MLVFNKNKLKNKFSFKKILGCLKDKYSKYVVKNKSKFSMKETLLFMIITFVFGMIVGGVVMYGRGSFSGHISESLDEFITTYNDILDNYYKDIDGDELLESGISGMISYLGDPYAAYMTETETKSFNETVEGKYCGIGAEIVYTVSDKTIRIGEIFENSPASHSDLKTGDILIKVNDKDIASDMSLDVIANMVKGEEGTSVSITIKRENKILSFNIKRGSVDIQSVTSELYEKNNKKIGYLGISVFADNTDEQFMKAIKDLESQKIDSLIVDLRGNSGGYLTSVTNIMSMFIPKDGVLYKLSTKGNVEVVKDKTKEKRDYPIVVLVNGSSASASELLCACLKEEYGATIIGTTTFGKGRVQKAYTLSNGSLVKYTFQEWLTPKGNSIDLIGIEPNIKIEYKYDENSEIDNQLAEAINVLSK